MHLQRLILPRLLLTATLAAALSVQPAWAAALCQCPGVQALGACCEEEPIPSGSQDCCPLSDVSDLGAGCCDTGAIPPVASCCSSTAGEDYGGCCAPFSCCSGSQCECCIEAAPPETATFFSPAISQPVACRVMPVEILPPPADARLGAAWPSEGHPPCRGNHLQDVLCVWVI